MDGWVGGRENGGGMAMDDAFGIHGRRRGEEEEEENKDAKEGSTSLGLRCTDYPRTGELKRWPFDF